MRLKSLYLRNSQEEIFAVIPARGGSKRIKKKNLYPILGKPLIAYTIEIAKKSGIFSHIIVNSEDDEILAVAEKYGAEVYYRPHNLAIDTTFVIEVIQEMISSMRLKDETILGILLPTCPLRSGEDIREAYKIFCANGGKIPVVSVTYYETPIQLAQIIAPDNRLDPVFPEDYKRSTRSTDHRPTYRYNEGIIFNIVKNLKSQNNLIGERPIPYIMPPERSIIIDNQFQIELIEMIMNFKKSNQKL
ncbi:MAG: acylneuraminate cytidylyltransferase family protein [Candidatus Heimdallarchaeaceae archaeon]